MPGGNKRAAEEINDHETERVSKASKTSNGSAGKGGAKNGGAKAASAKPKLTKEEFKSKALPLHVMLTHTPPSILKEGLIEEDGTEEHESKSDPATDDAGFVGSLTLLPSSFSTGSYGWKGNKRVTVELQAGEVGPDGTREKVQVMLTINATVLGSKPDKDSAKGVQKKQSNESDQAEVEDPEASAEEAEANEL